MKMNAILIYSAIHSTNEGWTNRVSSIHFHINIATFCLENKMFFIVSTKNYLSSLFNDITDVDTERMKYSLIDNI